MKKIKPNNKIFGTKEFQKDKFKFFIILKNFDSTDLELYSDKKNYIVCRGKKSLPTWIWTKDNLDENIIDEIENVIKLYLTDADKDKFTCKEELYKKLKKHKFENLNSDDYFKLGFLICNKTKKPKYCDGFFDKPDLNEIDILAKYWYDACLEMDGVDSITLEEAEECVKKLILDDTFYIWKNNEKKIVCIASYSTIGEIAKISGVYTPAEERRKGYAANLVCKMTNIILESGIIPMMYTDYNYLPSNKAYYNAGFENNGYLINFSCSKR